ncbi:MAG: hypothetical protein QOF87_3815 [Pseudonocardiales bacterium]|jgi:hypothetical protein|nr:hypothetical protein [Pseudonocardiales bacterium]MDT4964168.1 hypothetical protein [Pseudonocardiales bacterium]
MTEPERESESEFERQVQVVVDLGYPVLADMTEPDFRAALAPLGAVADRIAQETTVAADDHVPFVIVVPAVPVADAAQRMTLKGKPATLMLAADELDRFTPIPAASVPTGLGYLLVDVDTGTEFCGVRPADALPVITVRGRTPLTIAEGVALVTQRPDMLRKNKCFSLLASRCGDKRVPAIWISAGAPKLGWCWDGNPHTWLGAASAGARVAG